MRDWPKAELYKYCFDQQSSRLSLLFILGYEYFCPALIKMPRQTHKSQIGLVCGFHADKVAKKIHAMGWPSCCDTFEV